MKEKLGLDFDGVIRKFPRFVEWYANFLSPNDLLVRARLFWLRKILTRFFMDFIPLIIDGRLIYSIEKNWEGPVILISGRCTEKHKEQLRRVISNLPLKFDKVFLRENWKEYEEKFKERIIKREKVDVYIDDRKFIVEYLKKKNINAIHISEIRR
ncbi:MAG: hypothetical protein DRJ03_15425 [Chloroflexi bacterium]|nr:MAG: hypothetical protein DRJ03_15425 [Chloroflexota bacterium]